MPSMTPSALRPVDGDGVRNRLHRLVMRRIDRNSVGADDLTQQGAGFSRDARAESLTRHDLPASQAEDNVQLYRQWASVNRTQ